MLLYTTNDEGMVHDISYHPNVGRGDHACIYFLFHVLQILLLLATPKFDLNCANYDGMWEFLGSTKWHSKFHRWVSLMLGIIFIMFLIIH